MATNDFLVKRTAYFQDVTIGNAATTWSSGVIIPAGAIITGVKMMAPGAVTTTDASATIQLRVGTNSIISTTKINAAVGAVTIPITLTLNQAGGVYVPASGELNMIVSASSVSACTAVVDVYVDYLYVV
jgi:hypothetical protein